MFRSGFFSSLVVLGARACDTQAELEAMRKAIPQLHDGRGGMDLPKSTAVNVTLLPQNKGNESPACLDGSPYGYYYVPSKTKSTKWTISISGGGWCYNEDLCLSRASTDLGSSKNWKAAGCGCMNIRDNALPSDKDPIDHDCNCIYMPYGDGASFSGYRADPWPVPNSPGSTLYFRGIKNLDATIQQAFTLGMDKATDVVLTGGSAGGLSTFLHLDRLANSLKQVAPSVKVRGAPVVGYFLDHDNVKHDSNNYTAWMKYIYHMQNLTFGSDGGLTASCGSKYPQAPHYCFMSPHMNQVIQTPFFVFNSKFDSWQLANELQVNAAHGYAGFQKDVIAYGQDFDKQFQVVTTEQQNGGFITTCICHGCPWADLILDGSNAYQHYYSWTMAKATNHYHIDMRGPNGDGALNFSSCAAFSPVGAAQ